MKVAAVNALADLAREDVPDAVIRAYGGNPIRFGPDYIIPKPLDTRVLLKVVPAVAQAAVSKRRARVSRCPNGRPTSSAWRPAWGRSGRSCAKSFSVHSRDAQRIVLPEGDHPVSSGPPTMRPKKGLRSRCYWETRKPFVRKPSSCMFPWTASTSWTTAKTRM
jgi:hypothetical protein